MTNDALASLLEDKARSLGLTDKGTVRALVKVANRIRKTNENVSEYSELDLAEFVRAEGADPVGVVPIMQNIILGSWGEGVVYPIGERPEEGPDEVWEEVFDRDSSKIEEHKAKDEADEA